jgi:hypothetical protein
MCCQVTGIVVKETALNVSESASDAFLRRQDTVRSPTLLDRLTELVSNPGPRSSLGPNGVGHFLSPEEGCGSNFRSRRWTVFKVSGRKI